MEIHQLRYFLAVVQSGSFTAAAKACAVSQPSLSAQIAKLEGELGGPLLERGRQGARLTPRGELFRGRASEALRQLESGRLELEELSGLKRGSVSLGCMPTSGAYLLPPLLKAFGKAHPEISVSLREESSPGLAKAIRDSEVELAILDEAGLGAGIQSEILFSEPLLIAVPPRHSLAGRKKLDLKALQGEPLILMKSGHGFRKIVLDALAKAGVEPRVVHESGEIETVQALVEAGLGLSLVPKMVKRLHGPAYLEIAAPTPSRTLYMAWREGAALSAAASALKASALGEPGMIHCVNLNATWDTVLLCSDLKDGGVNKAFSAVSYPGGKGNNAARAAALLGAKANLFAFCGEADKPAALKFYEGSGVKAHLFAVKGRNRPCVILLDAARDKETVINSPSQLSFKAADLEKLKKALLKAIEPGDLVTFSGSLPEGLKPTTYKDMIKAVQAAGAVAMLDAYGPALKCGIEAAPFLVKPNADEIGETFGWKVNTREEILRAAERLLKFGSRVVVVTLGARGAIVRTHREALFVSPLPETRGWHSPVGCGDSFFGALALGLDKGKDLKDCLGLATAAAWANLQAPGAVFFDKRLAKAQASQVRVSRIRV